MLDFPMSDSREVVYSQETLQIMGEGWKLSGLLLDKNGGDFAKAAEELSDYDTAHKWLKETVLPALRRDRAQTLRCLRLLLDMAEEITDDLDFRTDRAWAVERAARSIVFHSAFDQLNYTPEHKRPPEERFGFYPKVFDMVRAWLADGQYLIRTATSWAYVCGSNWGGLISWDLFANRKRCRSRAAPFTFEEFHKIARELHRQRVEAAEPSITPPKKGKVA